MLPRSLLLLSCAPLSLLAYPLAFTYHSSNDRPQTAIAHHSLCKPGAIYNDLWRLEVGLSCSIQASKQASFHCRDLEMWSLGLGWANLSASWNLNPHIPNILHPIYTQRVRLQALFFRMLSKHERYYALGMDALVIVCSRNTNVTMVWAWML